jgi:hypothetical protein
VPQQPASRCFRGWWLNWLGWSGRSGLRRLDGLRSHAWRIGTDRRTISKARYAVRGTRRRIGEAGNPIGGSRRCVGKARRAVGETGRVVGGNRLPRTFNHTYGDDTYNHDGSESTKGNSLFHHRVLQSNRGTAGIPSSRGGDTFHQLSVHCQGVTFPGKETATGWSKKNPAVQQGKWHESSVLHAQLASNAPAFV